MENNTNFYFKNIDKFNGRINEIKEDMFHNIDTLNQLLSEVEKLKVAYDTVCDEKRIVSKSAVINDNIDEKLEDTSNTLLEEINYYYLRIRDLNFSDLDELKKELPSKRKANYHDIILGINAFLMKDMNEIRVFIESEKKMISIKELEDFKSDILDIQKKMNAIFHVSRENELKTEENMENNEMLNNIVFLETESGNIYALDDLDNNSVPSEYYEGFYELIHSIEDGTFKNVKTLSGNYKTAGISEVKGFKKRIIFDRVGYDTYAIIGAFIKKSDKDKSYLEPLKNRIAIYRRNRDHIVKMINEKEGYLDSQRNILKQIYKLLQVTEKKRR